MVLKYMSHYTHSYLQLRLKGRNVEENQHVKMGAYHTIDVEAQRKFTLTKQDGWDSVALDRVDQACDAATTADLAAIVMQEGLANICLVTSSMTVQKQKVIQFGTNTLPNLSIRLN